ncbi:MAG TPA: GNAT family N-acetyltransferase [Limnochordales bacterium]|nr:GNAT family N-acetyltransferase [Limnochordales bacterium]
MREGGAKKRGTRPGGAEAPARRAWRAECSGWLALGRAPEARGLYTVARHGGFILIRRDPRAGHRLPAMLLVENDGPVDPADGLELALAMLGPVGEPVYLCLAESVPGPQWEAALADLGFRRETTQLLMTCPLPRTGRPAPGTAQRAPSPRVQVMPADGEKDRRAALAVVGEGFRDPPDVAAFYNPRGVVRLYLARVGDEPAGAAALWPFAGVAGIYSVTTRPRFRRQGVAYALLERMLDDAQAAGFELASLRTTHHLEPLYARHGFRASGHVHRYRRDP